MPQRQLNAQFVEVMDVSCLLNANHSIEQRNFSSFLDQIREISARGSNPTGVVFIRNQLLYRQLPILMRSESKQE